AAIAERAPDLWRYHEVLPVRDPAHVSTLGEGMTPLVALPRHGARLGVPRLLMKDEGLVPTGSFKARGAAVGVSRAVELGVGGIAGELPRLVAVQAAGCAPIVDAFEAGLAESTPPADPHTVAFGITVPKALGDFLVLDAVRSTGGTAVAVTDEELLAAQAA